VFRVTLWELIKEVDFKDVEKQLILTDSNFKNVIHLFYEYYMDLQQKEGDMKPLDSIIKMDRELFHTVYFVPTEQRDVIEELTTYIPLETILCSKVYEKDLMDLEKPLIVAGALYYLTFGGTCFSEEKRKQEYEKIKFLLEDVHRVIKSI
jgi:hypothetical protein